MKYLAVVGLIVCALVQITAWGLPAQGTYEIDKSHTNVGFKVSHMNISLVVGRFNEVNGSFTFNPNGDSSVDVTVRVSSVDTNNKNRDNHLIGDDFFDAAQFPNMTFKSSKVNYATDGNVASIDGTLSFHGVENEVTFNVQPVGDGKDPRGKSRAGFQATTTIQRSEYGMDKLLAAAGDTVMIEIQIEGIKK